MIEKRCPGCLNPFDTFTWKKINGYYKCPCCGGIHDMDALDLDNKDKRYDLINRKEKIYRLLKNLFFKESESELRDLRDEYPDDPEVYYLSALSENCICYMKNDNKLKWKYDYIPTLNNIDFKNIFETNFVNIALDKAKDDPEVFEYYTEVFKYIENTRKKIQNAYINKDYNYDIFISTKITKINEKGEIVYDDKNNAVKTTDYELASKIYDIIRKDDVLKNKKVFLSEKEKKLFVGEEYEHIIFSALHSAKVFILVGNSRFNIEWPWVRNEWMRYLYLKESSNETEIINRKFIFVTEDMKINEIPREFNNLQHVFLNENYESGINNLLSFIKKTFVPTIVKIEPIEYRMEQPKQKNVEVTSCPMGTLKKSTDYGTLEVNLQQEIEICIYDINQNPYSNPNKEKQKLFNREKAFEKLENIVSLHPEAYLAHKYLLLKNSKFYSFDNYFESIYSIASDVNFINEYFKVATEEDSKEAILKICKMLSNFELKSKKDINAFNKVFSIIDPYYLEYAPEKNLKEVSNNIINSFINIISYYEIGVSKDNTLSNMKIKYPDAYKKLEYYEAYDRKINFGPDENQLFDSYLKIEHFISNDNYIPSRKMILSKLINYKIYDNTEIYRYIKKILNEILYINEGDDDALGYSISLNISKRLLPADNFFERLNALSISIDSGAIINNKEIIELFHKLEKFAPIERKPIYIYMFIRLIINDPKTYLHNDEFILQESTGTSDEELNGFDLFFKMIKFELGKCDNISSKNNLYINPSPDIYLLKNNPNRLDEVLCLFAYKMQSQKIFDAAIKIYNQYIVQQNLSTSLDCLYVQYFIELAKNKVNSFEEAKTVGIMDFSKIKPWLISLVKTDFRAQNFLDELDELSYSQKQFYEYRVQSKKKLDYALSFDINNRDNYEIIYDSYKDYSSYIEKISVSSFKQIIIEQDSEIVKPLDEKLKIMFDKIVNIDSTIDLEKKLRVNYKALNNNWGYSKFNGSLVRYAENLEKQINEIGGANLEEYQDRCQKLIKLAKKEKYQVINIILNILSSMMLTIYCNVFAFTKNLYLEKFLIFCLLPLFLIVYTLLCLWIKPLRKNFIFVLLSLIVFGISIDAIIELFI